MFGTILEVIAGLAAAAAIYEGAFLVARGYRNKQQELIARRLGKGREDGRATSRLSIQADVEHDEGANKQNDEQYPAEPANK